MLPIPSLTLSAGGGGPSGATASNGIGTPISNPFNFDDSGWIVNFGNGNNANATGNRDANQTAQTPSAGGALGGILGGIQPNMLLLAAAAYFLLRRK
jgi:hypothetical protein